MKFDPPDVGEAARRDGGLGEEIGRRLCCGLVHARPLKIGNQLLLWESAQVFGQSPHVFGRYAGGPESLPDHLVDEGSLGRSARRQDGRPRGRIGGLLRRLGRRYGRPL